MNDNNLLKSIEEVLANMPGDWLRLTTHRLDIYNEERAKSDFIEEFENLLNSGDLNGTNLSQLPTAYDYIRLGHPLSSILEWCVAKMNTLKAEYVISFSSQTMPVLAILRTNALANKKTRIAYAGNLPEHFNTESLTQVYGYDFELIQVENPAALPQFEGSTIFISHSINLAETHIHKSIDFLVSLHDKLGSILLINGAENADYVALIQHVRRRESIAMTPADSLKILQLLTGKAVADSAAGDYNENKTKVVSTIQEITATQTKVLLGSSGLSVQYAIMMGLIDDALEKHPGKAIKIIVPPNCYGGTNDQARRVAASIDRVEILDLPVDGDNDMVKSTDQVLDQVAREDGVPYIIAEIPTNPRVEVPDLDKLRETLSKKRKTPSGEPAIDPVFILDQTFCPNVQFLSEQGILASIRTISYVSGSKFPSGGKCTAGYCVANKKAENLLDKIDKHFKICDNEATDLQVEILAEQLPSMNSRIVEAYKNTREFVNFIKETLPTAKINFVSEELAQQGFTPSVFSLDLPTKGDSAEEKETYKRALNLKLINMMITAIPEESKYCVSYGQLKGCYWTIPATSTQGTTKEGDKDYIVRVSLSPNLNLDLHKEVFTKFVNGIN
ncbi:PLP-dependent aminotransferase family protein [Leeuwenhoekiella aequorea]|uniref:Cys/Met metabolism PLP-dependent enzyme n=1 Tax=Leeuwenhoekiella aequorea TaxID=283736 RepID=A0A4Q0P4Q2_9FLAO|nr:PLP-dependent transferase [Leeuwenhoekiella aequorea]AOE07022.1 cystathionine beta-synthase [uncultured bacterium]RXG21108.1 Cys/Met metabolism PLP-dependent enzyme [Leeuwenhoekiella aequorea]